MTTFFA